MESTHSPQKSAMSNLEPRLSNPSNAENLKSTKGEGGQKKNVADRDDAKGDKNNKKANKTKSGKSASSRKKDKQKTEVTKKSYKVVIRRLPTKDFSIDTFRSCLDRVLAILQIPPDTVEILHFMEGKLRYVTVT